MWKVIRSTGTTFIIQQIPPYQIEITTIKWLCFTWLIQLMKEPWSLGLGQLPTLLPRLIFLLIPRYQHFYAIRIHRN